ncbi:MAG: hypothetical protein PHQ98_02035 [Candidatus ainarchaeum sp.]|nr:hypothetical protein [Candidatus ainarchaeum sp.]
MNQIKAIVWDIGGVLLENPFIGEFWKNKEGSEELRHKFGSGKITKTEFINQASKMLGIPKKNFIEEYGKAYFPIKKINEVFKIFLSFEGKNYLFSDTNPIHLEFIKLKYPEIFKKSENIFMSSKIGYRKKDLESYDILINKIDLLPEEILFIDDSMEIINLAKKKGISTILYNNPKQLKKELKEKLND